MALPHGRPPAPRAEPVGRLVSGEHGADATDAAVFTTPDGEPLHREGRPGALPQEVLNPSRRCRRAWTRCRESRKIWKTRQNILGDPFSLFGSEPAMPRRELSRPKQIVDWLEEWGKALSEPASMILIGSAALLWHAADRGLDTPLPENSMDVDPVTDSDALAWMCYDALIGSEFERTHGWHVNLLPASVLQEFSEGWETRASRRSYGNLTVIVPAPADLLVPKLKRGEPRDRAHAEWAKRLGMV